jgi:hypothetical protein
VHVRLDSELLLQLAHILVPLLFNVCFVVAFFHAGASFTATSLLPLSLVLISSSTGAAEVNFVHLRVWIMRSNTLFMCPVNRDCKPLGSVAKKVVESSNSLRIVGTFESFWVCDIRRPFCGWIVVIPACWERVGRLRRALQRHIWAGGGDFGVGGTD